MTQILSILFGVVLGGALVGLVIFVIAHARKQAILSSFRYQLLLVKIPKPALQQEDSDKNKVNVAEAIGPFESFLINAAKPKSRIVFEIAQPNVGEEIFFYVAADRRDSDAVEKIIKSYFPGSEVSVAKEDYNIFNPAGATLAATVSLSKSFYYPIRTYSQMGFTQTDPLDGILGAFSKLLRSGEGASYQVIVERAPSDYGKKLFKALGSLRKGENKNKVLDRGAGQEFHDAFIADPFKSKAAKEKEKEEPKIVDEQLVKALEFKGSKPLFRVTARLVASAEDASRAEDILDSLEHGFSQYVNEPHNTVRTEKARGGKLKDLIFKFSFRIGDSQSMILNGEEVASMLHFPNVLTKTPNVHWLQSRSAPPPVNIPTEGLALGKSLFGAEEKIIRLTDNDRRRHTYIIGQTGTGKSVLMKEMIRQDILAGKGCGYIDPHGDAAETILGFVPEERMKDVVYFDPGYLARPVALNALEYDARYPEHKTFIINELYEIIDKLYNLKETGGPIFEQYFRNGMLLVMDDPEKKATLLDFVRIFADEYYREDLIATCKNPLVVQFWTKEAPQASRDFAISEVVTYITSKLSPFLANDFIRPVVAQRTSAFNFREILDQKKIFIVNLSKGKLGETNSFLLGMIIVSKLLMSAFSRIDLPEDQRNDFFLYIDEFQNVTTKSIATIFAEARKYRLNLIVANQYIKQLAEDIQSAILGNVGTLVSFRIGPEDVEMMEKPFHPVFTRTDLVSIPNFRAYARLLVNNQTAPPFDLATFPPAEVNREMITKIKEQCYQNFGRPLKEIEEEIAGMYK